MTAAEDFVYATWDGDDFAQHDPFLVCRCCHEKLCTIEEGDSFAILAAVVDAHACSEPESEASE